ncbi:MAG: alpha/beta hydrolase [Ferruginibacter sp.]
MHLVYYFLLMFSLPFTALSQITRSGKVERGDCSLYYNIVGTNGQYVIVLGGGPGSEVNYMQPIADSLSGNFQCIMLEQRGTGRSTLKKYDSTTVSLERYINDIDALSDHLKTGKVILAGNSWGSMLALLYAKKFPQKVQAILSFGFGILSEKYAAIASDNFKIRLTAEEKETRKFWKEKMKDSASFVQANYERDKAGMPAYYYNREIAMNAAKALKPSDFNYYLMDEFFQVNQDIDLRNGLNRITAPVLFIQGRQDVAGEENIIETHRLVKKSELHFLERCGHFPWEERSEETWKIVYDFLNRRHISAND